MDLKLLTDTHWEGVEHTLGVHYMCDFDGDPGHAQSVLKSK